jgi:stearoyl-CoA desaturase (Delta-9 desaturase)
MHWVLGIVVGLLTAQFGILVTSVYLHRGVAHKALTVHPAVAMFCRVFIWIATGMRPREWVAVHRRHHAATDTPDDPHSPAVVGFWRVQLANAALYRRRARDGETVPKYGRDVPTDRLDRWFFDRAWLGLGIGVTLLCLILGWRTGLLAAVVHAVAYLGLSGAVNAVGHTIGRRPYPNSATNGQFLALITSGEGLHNNHHAAPTSARFSLARGQFDPGYLAVRILTTLHLATIRHDDVKLKRAA